MVIFPFEVVAAAAYYYGVLYNWGHTMLEGDLPVFIVDGNEKVLVPCYYMMEGLCSCLILLYVLVVFT